MAEPARETPTELEGAALAVIAQGEGCTAYHVKRAFEISPSEYWSGSAGAVYPLVKRLESRGLIERGAQRSRGARTLRITSAGCAALRSWFSDVERAVSPGFDPLRTRLHLAPAVGGGALAALLEGVQVALLEQLEAPPAPPGDRAEVDRELYRLWIECRLEWLRRAVEAGLL